MGQVEHLVVAKMFICPKIFIWKKVLPNKISDTELNFSE